MELQSTSHSLWNLGHYFLLWASIFSARKWRHNRTFKETVHTMSLAQSLTPPPLSQAYFGSLPNSHTSYLSCAFVPMKYTDFSFSPLMKIPPGLRAYSWPFDHFSPCKVSLLWNFVTHNCLCPHERHQKSTRLSSVCFAFHPRLLCPLKFKEKEVVLFDAHSKSHLTRHFTLLIT